jgi:acetyltransferase-like isoleucine patch superfamily enzyme
MLRRILLKFDLGPIGIHAEDHVAVRHCTILEDVSFGYRSYANACTLRAVSVGRFCSIGRHCSIGAARHRIDAISSHPYLSDSGPQPHTSIGHDVWIGDHAIIVSGVKIGTGAVIGGGAVVTTDVAPYAIVGGVPAQLIRQRFDAPTVERLLASEWWDYGDAVAGLSVEDALVKVQEAIRLPEHFRRR